MCNIKREDYVNQAQLFYCEFLKLAKSTFPTVNLFQYSVEDIIDKGLMTHNRELFEKIEEVSRFLNFSYTEDFVLITYKPYYALYSEWKYYCEEKGLADKTDKDLWNHWGGLLRHTRGIVLHRHSGDLVINPYEKFFNIDEMDECNTENVVERVKDANVVEISEKLDGSLIMARYYNGKYVMSSSGQLDENKCPQLKEAYDILVRSALMRSMIKHYPSLTFIFELISPNDAHVVKYDGDSRLVLIGIKSTKSNYIFPYAKVRNIASDWYIPCTRIYNSTLEDILSSRDEKKAFEAEGFVLNVDGYRVKIKYNDYLNVAGFVSSLNPKVVIKAVADNCVEELKLSCPGCTEYINKIIDVITLYIKKMTEEIDECYEKGIRATKDKVEFMKYVQMYVPHHIIGFVIQRYYDKFTIKNLLKTFSGKYIKYYKIKEYLKDETLEAVPF